MMIERQKVRDAVLRAVEQANELSVDGNALRAEESAILFGGGAGLDSMDFVNFIAAVEDEMSRLTDRPLNLLKKLNDAESQHQRPLTLALLIDSLCDGERS